MSINARRPHNLSPLFASCVNLDYVREHTDTYTSIHTPEDIRYLVALFQCLEYQCVPRPQEFVDRVAMLASKTQPVHTFPEDKLWIASLERWLAVQKRPQAVARVRDTVKRVVKRLKSMRSAIQ